MKKPILLIIVLFMAVGVLATEQTIIKTNINVTYDADTNTLRITGENLDWSKTIGNESWSQELELILIREMGNISDVTNLFEKLDVCLEQMNYTDLYIQSKELNLQLKADLTLCQENVSYADNYTQCQQQLSTQVAQKDTEKNDAIAAKQKELDDATKSRNLWRIAGIVGIVIAAYFIYKNRGGIFGKKEERTNLTRMPM